MLHDILDRLLQRETLVMIISVYLIASGRVHDMASASALIGTASSMIIGRSIVKASGNDVPEPPDVGVGSK